MTVQDSEASFLLFFSGLPHCWAHSRPDSRDQREACPGPEGHGHHRLRQGQPGQGARLRGHLEQAEAGHLHPKEQLARRSCTKSQEENMLNKREINIQPKLR